MPPLMLVTMHRNIHTISMWLKSRPNSVPKHCNNYFSSHNFFCLFANYLLNVYTYGQAFLIETAHNILNPENLLTKLPWLSSSNGFHHGNGEKHYIWLHRKKKKEKV